MVVVVIVVVGLHTIKSQQENKDGCQKESPPIGQKTKELIAAQRHLEVSGTRALLELYVI